MSTGGSSEAAAHSKRPTTAGSLDRHVPDRLGDQVGKGHLVLDRRELHPLDGEREIRDDDPLAGLEARADDTKLVWTNSTSTSRTWSRSSAPATRTSVP